MSHLPNMGKYQKGRKQRLCYQVLGKRAKLNCWADYVYSIYYSHPVRDVSLDESLISQNFPYLFGLLCTEIYDLF